MSECGIVERGGWGDSFGALNWSRAVSYNPEKIYVKKFSSVSE